MKVAEAADVWANATRELKRLESERETAAGVLKEWFKAHPKQRAFRGLIGFSIGSRTNLDTAKVKAELGDRLPDFQKVITFEQLSLLK
jgi:hypothetical protein